MRNLSLSNSPLWSALSVFIGAIPLAYLALYPKLAAVLWRNHALGLAAFVVLGLEFVALGIGNARGVWAWLKRVPRPLVWLMALLFALPMLHAANVLQVRFNALTLIPLYAVVLGGALGLVAWREWGERGVLPLDAGRDKRGALRLALIFALVSLAANYFVVWGFNISSGIDMPRYTIWGQKLFDLSGKKQILLWDGFPYLFIHNITQSAQTPIGIISANILLSTLAVFAMTYVVARRNTGLAVAVGLTLALDITWLAVNRGVQTEGPTAASLVIALAILTSHFYASTSPRKQTMFLSGVLYAFLLAMRVSNLALLLPIGLVYGLNKRLRRNILYLLTGFVFVIGGFMLFNLWRYQVPSLTQQTSVNFDAALFIIGLFEPSNGEASQDYQQQLLKCYPDMVNDDNDFRKYLARQADAYPYSFMRSIEAVDCLNNNVKIYNALIGEAIRAKPLEFIYAQFAQNSAAFALAFDPIIVTENTLIGYSNVLPFTLDVCQWCPDFINRKGVLDVRHPFWQTLANIYSVLRQPYLLWGTQPNVPQYMGNLPVQSPFGQNINRYEQWFYRDSDYCTGNQPCISLSVAVAWFLWGGFVIIVTRKWMRLLAVMAMIFIHILLGLATVGFMFEARYALSYTPLMMLISAIGWVTIGAGLWQLLTRKEGKQA